MYILRFLLGGSLYCLIEILWRGHTHSSMFLLGGGCFCLLARIGRLPCSFARRVLLATEAVTAAEFLSGLLLNRVLKLGIWDYSGQPLNLLGQICPLFILLWVPLCAAGILLNGLLDRFTPPSARRRAAL